MLFDDELIARVLADPSTGVVEAIALTRAHVDLESGQGWTEDDYQYLLEALALLTELREGGLFQAPFRAPRVSGEYQIDCPEILAHLDVVERHCQTEKGKLQFSTLRNKLGAALRTGFSYEFTDGDVERIQELLNELRELISDSTLFEATHQRRLLMRLERLQSEMHKRVSDLDKFWGLLGDAGVALGKFGKDAKPIVDRVREITGIVWRTQAHAEELPSDSPQPLLSAPEETSGES